MKTTSRILLTFIMLVFFTGMIYSQAATATSNTNASAVPATVAPGKSVDANKNSTCDKHDAKSCCAQGKNFVDKNGDGKCDNCGTPGKCKGTGNCIGKGQCNGKGQGKGNCCGQGQQHKNGCGNQGSAPATEPKK